MMVIISSRPFAFLWMGHYWRNVPGARTSITLEANVMNNVIYLVGLIVVVCAILAFVF